MEVFNQTSRHQDPTPAIVDNWDASGHWGFVKHMCGCDLFVSVNEVQSLDHGDQVIVSQIVKNKHDNRGGWVGRQIESAGGEE